MVHSAVHAPHRVVLRAAAAEAELAAAAGGGAPHHLVPEQVEVQVEVVEEHLVVSPLSLTTPPQPPGGHQAMPGVRSTTAAASRERYLEEAEWEQVEEEEEEREAEEG